MGITEPLKARPEYRVSSAQMKSCWKVDMTLVLTLTVVLVQYRSLTQWFPPGKQNTEVCTIHVKQLDRAIGITEPLKALSECRVENLTAVSSAQMN